MVDVYLSVDEVLKMILRPQTIIIKILLTNKCMILEDEIFGFMTASKVPTTWKDFHLIPIGRVVLFLKQRRRHSFVFGRFYEK